MIVSESFGFDHVLWPFMVYSEIVPEAQQVSNSIVTSFCFNLV